MAAPKLSVVLPDPPTPAELSREALRGAELHAAEAVQDALRAMDTARSRLDALSGLPVKVGVVQAASTLSRAILTASNTIASLEGRG
jgi:cell division protein FtsX